MFESVKDFLTTDSAVVSIFIVTGSLIILAFVVLLILSFAKPFFGIKEKCKYLPCLAGISLIQFSLCVLSNEGLPFCLFSLGLGLMCFFLLVCVRGQKEEPYKFYSRKQETENNKLDENDKVCTLVAKEENYSDLKSVDYSHVKNILERLEFVNLSDTDKRQISELQNNICKAEDGENDKELQSKINDGLSYLLKTMSKYGM